MKKMREIVAIVTTCVSVLLYMMTFLFTINEYDGKPGMPFVVSLSAVSITIIFLILSIVALIIGYLLSKKGKIVTLTSIMILMLNIYRFSEMTTILKLISKLEIPSI